VQDKNPTAGQPPSIDEREAFAKVLAAVDVAKSVGREREPYAKVLDAVTAALLDPRTFESGFPTAKLQGYVASAVEDLADTLRAGLLPSLGQAERMAAYVDKLASEVEAAR